MNNQKSVGKGIGLWIVAAAAILLFSGGVIYLSRTTKSQGPTVADVVRSPESYYGQQVSLKGEIENIKSPRVFTLDQEGAASGDEVLVVSIPSVEPQGGSGDDITSLNDQDVQVSGTVRKFVSADIKRTTGLDLDPQTTISFENKPVIIAREVEFLPEHQTSPK